jgi:UDP-N-acetylmuramoyl-L-alanyl-D-glutamate--2,6-diaminopimelate ligase
MRLKQIIPSSPEGAADVEISALAYDNRTVTPGTLFFCVPGFTRDGHDFADDALARGASALVVERPLELAIPQVVVGDVRAAMAPAAAAFFADPTAELQVSAVTGTNGKTTSAYLLRALLEADGRQTGLLGTVKSVIGGQQEEVQRTTPEAVDLQRSFRRMLDGGDHSAVIEASSHALELHRVDAIHFQAAIFTNLTQDHLDFHPTMEDYYAAKRKLFTDLQPAHSIINLDDQYGARLANELPGAITFSLVHKGASYFVDELVTGLRGVSFKLHGPGGGTAVWSPLRGTFNVSNAVGAIAAAESLGVPAESSAVAIASAPQVPGRFETVDQGQPFGVIVDYAHTPDSLENVLQAARALTDKHLHVVFGCGGDRDRTKRPLMGQIAARLADDVIVTSDNPRSEEPEAIIEEILAGIDRPVHYEVDRRVAINHVIAEARDGDVVVIAGKGHEQGQEFAGGHKLPFDDVTVAREALRLL